MPEHLGLSEPSGCIGRLPASYVVNIVHIAPWIIGNVLVSEVRYIAWWIVRLPILSPRWIVTVHAKLKGALWNSRRRTEGRHSVRRRRRRGCHV